MIDSSKVELDAVSDYIPHFSVVLRGNVSALEGRFEEGGSGLSVAFACPALDDCAHLRILFAVNGDAVEGEGVSHRGYVANLFALCSVVKGSGKYAVLIGEVLGDEVSLGKTRSVLMEEDASLLECVVVLMCVALLRESKAVRICDDGCDLFAKGCCLLAREVLRKDDHFGLIGDKSREVRAYVEGIESVVDSAECKYALFKVGSIVLAARSGSDVVAEPCELIDSPLVVSDKIVEILILHGVILTHKSLVYIDGIHHVDRVGRHIARNEVKGVADRHGVNKALRIPRHLVIDIARFDRVKVLEKSLGAAGSSGTAVGRDDIVVTGRLCRFDLLHELRDIAVVSGGLLKLKGYAESRFDC